MKRREEWVKESLRWDEWTGHGTNGMMCTVFFPSIVYLFFFFLDEFNGCL